MTSRTDRTDNSRETRDKVDNNESVLVIGDSMIKPIIANKLSRAHKVQIKSFPGATTEDLVDYIKPSLKRKPDKIIIHAGINDLKNNNPKTIAKRLKTICNSIKNDLPSAKIAVSSIIKRRDQPTLNDKISKVNSSLSTYALSNDVDFISNDSIGEDCLNNGGLHLNKKGIFNLCNNFRSYLN